MVDTNLRVHDVHQRVQLIFIPILNHVYTLRALACSPAHLVRISAHRSAQAAERNHSATCQGGQMEVRHLWLIFSVHSYGLFLQRDIRAPLLSQERYNPNPSITPSIRRILPNIWGHIMDVSKLGALGAFRIEHPPKGRANF